ncbi:MAG TPA: non-homologous end-joining DNA ligase [Gemmatimonadaceae bacterium]|nr:non-homologous end-joining DNA ligase [Gemmatimonadaceae bacterium]
MAATLTQERFSGGEWLFEKKLDGIRLLAYKQGKDVTLFSRNRLPQNRSYPEVVRAVAELPVRDAVLDGEATGVWAGGEGGRVAYHIFDVLWLNGRSVTQLPLEERRKLLAGLPLEAPLRRVAALRGDKPWEKACAEGWEGVIAKRIGSPYEHKRSKHWFKMKCEATQELVIGGFTDPQGGRVGLGALLVGFYDGDDFVFAGKVGTGFDTKLLLSLRTRLDKLEISKVPFTRAKGLPKLRIHWVRPEIVVQVAFMEWTGDDKMRHPRLLGIRADKTPRECIREA